MACVFVAVSMGMILAKGARGFRFESRTSPILMWRRSEARYVINIAIPESWEAYQEPDQIKLEIIASPIWSSGAEWKDGSFGKIWKNEVVLAYERLIRSQWNLIFRRTSCLRGLVLNPDQIWWHWGDLEGETGNLGKRLDWRDRNETWWEEALGSSDLVTITIWALGSCFFFSPVIVSTQWSWNVARGLILSEIKSSKLSALFELFKLLLALFVISSKY